MTLTPEQSAIVEARLADAETALHGLMVGKAAVTIAYDGESVTYTATSEGKLRSYIRGLQAQLGTVCGARQKGIRA
jgi:hypothetical protein